MRSTNPLSKTWASGASLLSQESSARLLHRFGEASPKLIEERSLLRRVDSKFAVNSTDILDLLDSLREDYKVVLGSLPSPFASIHTEYFDTQSQALYKSHVGGEFPSFKVRIRKYPERSLAFLEFKTRVSPSRNHKTRFERSFEQNTLGKMDRKRIKMITGFAAESFSSSCVIRYRRMTLVSVHHAERVTIDTRMHVSHDGTSVPFGPEYILEVKQALESSATPIMRLLRERKISRSAFSKYCAALQTLSTVQNTTTANAVLGTLSSEGNA